MRSKDVDSRWVHRFLYKWQWSHQSNNTKGAYLPEGCLEMEEMRLAHRAQRCVNNVPWELVLNFDQLWKSAYEPPTKVLAKRRCREANRKGDSWGEVRPDDLLGKKLDAVLKIVEGNMNARMGQCPKPSKLRKTAARTEFVVGGRQGVTAVSSCWANGDIGPLGICVASGSLPLSYIREMNSQWAGHVFLFESGSDSHFMTADTTLLYMEQLLAPVAHMYKWNIFYLNFPGFRFPMICCGLYSTNIFYLN